jgi:hypothetical protein
MRASILANRRAVPPRGLKRVASDAARAGRNWVERADGSRLRNARRNRDRPIWRRVMCS